MYLNFEVYPASLPAKSYANLLCIEYLQSYNYMRSERLHLKNCDTLQTVYLTSIYPHQLNTMHYGYS